MSSRDNVEFYSILIVPAFILFAVISAIIKMWTE